MSVGKESCAVHEFDCLRQPPAFRTCHRPPHPWSGSGLGQKERDKRRWQRGRNDARSLRPLSPCRRWLSATFEARSVRAPTPQVHCPAETQRPLARRLSTAPAVKNVFANHPLDESPLLFCPGRATLLQCSPSRTESNSGE